LGTAFGPLAAGALFDQRGSYSSFLVLAAVMTLASALALASLQRPAVVLVPLVKDGRAPPRA
ncbi:MAG TPA: hypothetical protein VJM11_19960, partial [Nevskiaceae bacterium]|nr:hypothetical protein [Nevskiaceae bacterium]